MPLSIIRNDITRVSADAIVNTANPRVAVGRGTDYAIYRAAGMDELIEARKMIGDIAPGRTAVTSGFGLNAKYIIHTVGPAWRGGSNGERETVAECYRNCLSEAARLKCESIAFPLISTGTYGFPKDEALNIAIREISEFLETDEMDVSLVVYDRESFVLSSELFRDVKSYIDDAEVASGFANAAPDYENAAPDDRSEFNAPRPDLYASRRMANAPLRDAEVSRRMANAPLRDAGALPQVASAPSSDFEELSTAASAPSEERKFQSSGKSGRGFLRNLFNRKDRQEEEARWREENLENNAPEEEVPEEAPEEMPETGSPILSPDAEYAEKSFAPAVPAEDLYALSESDDDLFESGKELDSQIFEEPAGAEGTRELFSKSEIDDALAQLIKNKDESFQQKLFGIIDSRGLSDPEVYKKANIDRKLFSKIRSNVDYKPTKKTAVAFAIALGLNLDETTDLLRSAGMSLSPSNSFDIIIRYCIEHKITNIHEINCILFEFDQMLLGA